VKIADRRRIENMIPAYYELLKDFSVDTWREVVLQYTQDEDIKFPEPAEFLNRIKGHLYSQQHQEENYFNSEEYRKRCDSPEALAAKKRFYETLRKACIAKQKQGDGQCAGALHVLHCLGEAVILEPYNREKQIQRRERDRDHDSETKRENCAACHHFGETEVRKSSLPQRSRSEGQAEAVSDGGW